MAAVNNGSVTTNKVHYTTFFTRWELVSQDQANNTSKIRLWAGINTGESPNTDLFYNNAVRIDSINVNGSKVFGSWTYSNKGGGGDQQLVPTNGGYMEIDIPHNADGTKTFNINMSAWTFSSSDYYGSADFELPTITPPATDKTVKLKVSGSYVDAVPYVKVNGSWKKATPKVKVSGSWKDMV